MKIQKGSDYMDLRNEIVGGIKNMVNVCDEGIKSIKLLFMY